MVSLTAILGTSKFHATAVILNTTTYDLIDIKNAVHAKQGKKRDASLILLTRFTILVIRKYMYRIKLIPKG